MAPAIPKPITVDVENSDPVSALLAVPSKARVCLLLAHGAGAGMEHPSMSLLAEGLFERGIATLRYQFSFMERHRKRPDPPPLCHATVRAAVRVAAREMAGAALIAGGRSFGGRMTSQAQAITPLPGVRGLAFFGFPLHPANQPAETRAAHLADVKIPMLFVQGTRDALADLNLLQPIIARMRPLATLEKIEHADHSFNVQVRSGRTIAEVRTQVLNAFSDWAFKLTG